MSVRERLTSKTAVDPSRRMAPFVRYVPSPPRRYRNDTSSRGTPGRDVKAIITPPPAPTLSTRSSAFVAELSPLHVALSFVEQSIDVSVEIKFPPNSASAYGRQRPYFRCARTRACMGIMELVVVTDSVACGI